MYLYIIIILLLIKIIEKQKIFTKWLQQKYNFISAASGMRIIFFVVVWKAFCLSSSFYIDLWEKNKDEEQTHAACSDCFILLYLPTVPLCILSEAILHWAHDTACKLYVMCVACVCQHIHPAARQVLSFLQVSWARKPKTQWRIWERMCCLILMDLYSEEYWWVDGWMDVWEHAKSPEEQIKAEQGWEESLPRRGRLMIWWQGEISAQASRIKGLP